MKSPEIYQQPLTSQTYRWELSLDFSQNLAGLEEDKTIEVLKSLIDDSKNFLGAGGVGKVYDTGDQCIKLIINRSNSVNSHLFDLGNDVSMEFEIQKRLQDFEHQGVFSPNVVGYYEGNETNAIVMEKLDAVNMQMVINGKEELPASFDLDDFFWRLERYIDEIHCEFGILHLDLEPRNIMIDCATGNPRVIDFGRSRLVSDDDPSFDVMAKKDFNEIEKAYKKMKDYLDKINKI